MELGGPDGRGFLAHAYAVSGNQVEARRVLDELLAELDRKYVSPYNIAMIFAGLGEANEMFAWLEKGLGRRDSNIVNLNIAPEFDAYRSDPRFVWLVRRVGLSPRAAS